MSGQKELDPHSTVLVVKNTDGREVGRIAATAPNANTYLQELARTYKKISVDYVQDEDYAMVSRMFSSPR